MEVAVEGPPGPALLRFGIEADGPAPRWLELWPWFTWPALVVALFGSRPFPYLLINWLLHGINVALVYALVRRLGLDRRTLYRKLERYGEPAEREKAPPP